MWKLSPEAEKKAKDLHERMRRPLLLSGARKTALLIEQLAETGEPAVIPTVASGLFSSNRAIHDASSAGVAALLKLVPSIELVRLNDLLGGYYWGYISERWNGLKPKNVEAFLDDTHNIPLGNLLSFHKNGYVRHSAIRFLSKVATGEELRFLLIRQNDWVNSISVDAQEFVAKKIIPEYLSHFINDADLLFHLLKCKRQDLSGIVSRYIDLLVKPEHREALRDAIGHVNERTGRKFVFYLLERAGDHLAETLRSGLVSNDPITRAVCLQGAVDCLDEVECATNADRLLSDKFIPVRQEAYEVKAKLSSSAGDVWRQCMFDKSRALRETAIFHLRKSGCDVGSLYRNRLSTSPDSFPALSGLVSCADPSDLPVFLGYLKSEFASRRSEAVCGVGDVGAEKDVLGLMEMLKDKSSRVVRAAFKHLQPIAKSNSKSLDSKSLFELVEHCNSPAGVDAVFRLLVEKGQWSSLAYLLRSSVNSDHCISSRSKVWLDYTVSQNRVFTQPLFEQRRQIQQAIDECQALMDEEFLRNWTAYLSSFGFTFSA